jgi:hypothetical protein
MHTLTPAKGVRTMGTLLLNARPVRQLSTSSKKISKHFARYLLTIMIRGAKRALSNQPAPKKLVSILLTKCLLIEQGEYDEHEGMFLLAVCQVSGGQVPTLVACAHRSPVLASQVSFCAGRMRFGHQSGGTTRAFAF